MPEITTAQSFLQKYPPDRPPPDEAAGEFYRLPAQDRYEIVHQVSQNPFEGDSYLRGLLPRPIEESIATLLTPIFQPVGMYLMRLLVARIRNSLESVPDLWEQRFRVAVMVYYLGSWQVSLQEGVLEDPADRWFDRSRRVIAGALETFYRQTAEDGSGDPRSPLFDTDDDGFFDREDAFPLDPFFHRDSDGDRMPDDLDSDPERGDVWHSLRRDERRSLQLPDGATVLQVVRHRDQLIFEIPIRFQFEEREARSRFRSAWPEAKRRVEEYLNQRTPAGLQIRLIEGRRRSLPVSVTTETVRDSPTRWGLDTVEKPGEIHTLAHEVMHWLLRWLGLRSDRYQEDYVFPKDRTFQPGVSVLAERSEIMRQVKETTVVPPEYFLIPIGLLQRGDFAEAAVQRFLSEALVDGSKADDDLANKTVTASRRLSLRRASWQSARLATSVDPTNSHAWHTLAAGAEELGLAEQSPRLQRRWFERMRQAAEEALRLAPDNSNHWLARAKALGRIASTGEDSYSIAAGAVKAGRRAVILNPLDYSGWYQLAICHAGLGEIIGNRDHFYTAQRYARFAEQAPRPLGFRAKILWIGLERRIRGPMMDFSGP